MSNATASGHKGAAHTGALRAGAQAAAFVCAAAEQAPELRERQAPVAVRVVRCERVLHDQAELILRHALPHHLPYCVIQLLVRSGLPTQLIGEITVRHIE